jgi:ABC-2 type transport system ATP-binding protein
MDEPTRSLDPSSAMALRAFIRDELKRRDGKTILLATHNLREAETLCDRVAILVKGKVRQIGTVQEVRRWGVDERRFRLEVGSWPEELTGPFRVVSDEPLNGIRRMTIALDPDARLDDVLRLLLSASVVLHACDRIEPDLEEAFSRITESETEGEKA